MIALSITIWVIGWLFTVGTLVAEEQHGSPVSRKYYVGAVVLWPAYLGAEWYDSIIVSKT